MHHPAFVFDTAADYAQVLSRIDGYSDNNKNA